MVNSILAKSAWGERVARDLSSLNPQSLGKVGVLLGGRSGEREISLLSGNGVLEALKRFLSKPRVKSINSETFLEEKLGQILLCPIIFSEAVLMEVEITVISQDLHRMEITIIHGEEIIITMEIHRISRVKGKGRLQRHQVKTNKRKKLVNNQ